MLAELDIEIAEGRASSRAEAVRLGIELMIRLRRERVIEAEYVAAYGRDPQEGWIGEGGLVLGGMRAAELESDTA